MKIISSNYMNQSLLSLIRPNVHGSLLCTNVFNHICRAIFPKLTQSMKMCIVAICYAIVFVHWSGYIFFSVCDANSGHVHWVLTTTWMNTHIRIIDNNAVQIWHMAAIGLSEFWKTAPQLIFEIMICNDRFAIPVLKYLNPFCSGTEVKFHDFCQRFKYSCSCKAHIW